MEKTVTVNIGGSPFIMTEGAYTILNSYLEGIRERISASEVDEVMQDIEERIAEIFSESITPTIQVIETPLVRSTMKIIGNCEAFGEKQSSSSTTDEYPVRRLYRSRRDIVFAGVCAGLADYLKVDVLLVRILAGVSLIAGGVGFWAYLIMWIFVPREPLMIKK